jgi:hypothetical protein
MWVHARVLTPDTLESRIACAGSRAMVRALLLLAALSAVQCLTDEQRAEFPTLAKMIDNLDEDDPTRQSLLEKIEKFEKDKEKERNKHDHKADPIWERKFVRVVEENYMIRGLKDKICYADKWDGNRYEVEFEEAPRPDGRLRYSLHPLYLELVEDERIV